MQKMLVGSSGASSLFDGYLFARGRYFCEEIAGEYGGLIPLGFEAPTDGVVSV